MLEEPSLIDTEFTIKFGGGCGIDGANWMNKHHNVAKGLLEGRFQHHVLELEVYVQESHKKELEQWFLTLRDIKLAADVDV